MSEPILARRGISELNEVEIYFLIEECGAFCWRMNHEMVHGRIPQHEHAGIDAEIERVRAQQVEALKQLPKFGITPLQEDGKHATDEYWAWYRKWNHWHKNMPESAWETVSASLSRGVSGDDLLRYRKEADAMTEELRAAEAKHDAEMRASALGGAKESCDCCGCDVADRALFGNKD